MKASGLLYRYAPRKDGRLSLRAISDASQGLYAPLAKTATYPSTYSPKHAKLFKRARLSNTA